MFVYIMAARMRFCQNILGNFTNSHILHAFIIISILASSTQAATTQPPTAPPNDTTPGAGNTNTTQAQTTTTTLPPTTTTTLPPTTTIAPNLARTTIGETVIGQCLCDLTGSACDVNCCCDEDCAAEDIAGFTCDPVSRVIDDKVCYQQQVFLFSSSPAQTAIEDDGLFCIYFDNYAERNFYLDPNFVQDFPTFNDYVSRYANPSIYGKATYTEPQFTLYSYYQFGDPIYIIYPNEARGDMVLPAPLASNQCVDQNSMAYLKEETTECVRDLPDLQTQCETLASLSYAAYAIGFRIVKTPGLFGYVENGTLIEITTAPTTTQSTTTPTTVTTDNTTQTTQTTATTVPTTTPSGVIPSTVQTLYDNPYTFDIDYTSQTHLCTQAGVVSDCNFPGGVIPNATFAGTTCSDVVKEVRYIVTTDGQLGIDKMEVQFVFDDVTTDSLTQKFSVTYKSVRDTATPVPRSGNPGYQVGKNLLYGTLNETTTAEGVTTQQIITNPDPTQGLTVIRATATGACSTATSTRIPIRFGEDMRTGCTIQLNLTSLSSGSNNAFCNDIQTSIIRAFEGPNQPVYDATRRAWVDNNRYVATFGNTGSDQVGDWTKIIVENRPIPNPTEVLPADTCRLSLGMHIQILYANVGALANPQPKILGVALLYDTIKDVKFRCVGAFCQDVNQDLTQNFEVSQTVSFVDASQPAVKYAGEAPIFIARVPNDFFYPFLYYTNSAKTVIISNLVIAFSLLVTSCFNYRLLFV